MNRRINKKSFMYSVISVALIFLVVNLVLIETEFSKNSFEPRRTKLLGDQIHRFELNVEKDLEKSVDVVARRAIVSVIDYSINGEHSIDNATLALKELMMNGTVNGEPMFLLENNTLNFWSQKIDNLGKKMGFDSKLNYTGIEIKLVDSFDLAFIVNSTIKITDELTNSSQTRNVSTTVVVPLDGFEDPLYPMNSFGRLRKLISPSPYLTYTSKIANSSQIQGSIRGTTIIVPSNNLTEIQNINSKITKILIVPDASLINDSLLNQFKGFISETSFSTTSTAAYMLGVKNATKIIPNNTALVIDEETETLWNLNNFDNLITNNYYVESTRGPSFLDRIEGRLYNTREYGLASMVNLVEFENAYIIINDTRSIIDYEYFNETGPVGKQVRGSYYEWLRVSNNLDGNVTQTQKYGVEELV